MRRRKYANKKSGGYDSKREHDRANELRLLERAGKIRDLQEQVKFELIPKQLGERSCSYVADFCYIDEHGSKIVEDVKGMKTRDYIIKRKLMLWVYGIKVLET